MTAIVLQGDARALPLPDASVDLIVTSPPYFGLRSYTDGGEHYGGQIGSEATPQEWVAALVECTAEFVRVLKPSGSLFVNLGDKYPGKQPGDWSRDTQPLNDHGRLGVPGYKSLPLTAQSQRDAKPVGWGNARPKSLLGLPWRYALACTDQLGLILRRDIIWAKPNGLPESVTDRCRSSHEYLFHLVRQPRYYAAVDEIREPHSDTTTRTRGWDERKAAGVTWTPGLGTRGLHLGSDTAPNTRMAGHPLGKLPGSVWRIDPDATVWDIPSQPLTVPPHLGVDHFAAFPMELPRRCVLGWSPPGVCTSCGEGRRPVSTQDFVKINEWTRGKNARGGPAHLNASRDLEAGRRAVSGRYDVTITGYACACTPHTDHPGTGRSSRPTEHGRSVALGNGVRDNPGGGYGNAERTGPWREYHFDGWTPPPTRPAVVLDPFAGTGTTLLAAAALGRVGIGVDLSADYCRLARWRTTDPGERARAMQVPKPPPVPDGQLTFDQLEVTP